MMKRFLFLIIGIVLSVVAIVGVVIFNCTKKNNNMYIDSENLIEEVKEIEDETVNDIVENQTVEENEGNDVLKTESNEVVNKDSTPEIKQENKQEVKSNKQTSNISNNSSKVINNSQPKEETKSIAQPEQIKEEQPKTQETKIEEPKQEENKPVENKPIEEPKSTTPVREFKINQNYINKLRNTIIDEVTNNISQLNKYGITEVSQYQIIVDSSICTCYGGNRNGWTYENISAYNTFKSSILKGTNMKIYAVDEYYNGEYIQTLCYYGH